MAKTKDFPVTHRLVMSLSIPMTLAYITTPLLGLVDSAVIGQMGDAISLAGLAVAAIIVDVVMGSFNFLRSGTTGLTAQAYGARNMQEAHTVLARALMIALPVGIVFACFSSVFADIGVWAIDPGVRVAESASVYLELRLLSMPAGLANYALLGWFIGLGRAGSALGLQILLNLTNIVLSIWLGLWLDMGLWGIGFATLVSECLAFVIGGIWAWWIIRHDSMPQLKGIMSKNGLLRLLRLNGHILIRSFALTFAFGYFTARGADYGETVLAANAILFHILALSGYFLDGLATAAEQLVGRSLGAGASHSFWRAIRVTNLWAFGIAALITMMFLVFGSQFVRFMSTAHAVQALGIEYLPLAALIPITGVLAFQMDGIFIGATWSRDMVVMMVLSLVTMVISDQFLKLWLGNYGLWIALHIFLIARGVSLGFVLPRRARQSFVKKPL